MEMGQVLLWSSLAIGVVLFLCRFLPQRSGEMGADVVDTTPHPTLRLVALLTPFIGLLLSLPGGKGPIFHDGQRLGLGFLIGGIATLGGCLHLLAPSRAAKSASAPVALASFYGTGIVVVAAALFFLRQSLFDALLGIAIGGFCVGFTLFLSLPRAARQLPLAGQHIAVGVGFLAALTAAVSLGVFRDPLTPELAKLTWSCVILAFAALGSLVVVGTTFLPASGSGAFGRFIPIAVLVGINGLALFQVATKITNAKSFALPGIGGLLLWLVVLAVLREGRRFVPATPLLSVPLIGVLVVTSGFLAALQTLQGVAVGIETVALFLAYPATMAFLSPKTVENSTSTDSAVTRNTAIGLLLFGTVLLLWRLFTTRWACDLRGVNMVDQYALFGLIVGAALPSLLALLPAQFAGGAKEKAGAGIGTLVGSALLTLAAPAAVLTLFGAKSAVALLVGLALGCVPVLAGETALLTGMLAVAVALALDQFTGTVLPAEAPTRAEKIRYLAMLMAAVLVTVVASNRVRVAVQEETVQQ